MAEFYGKVTVSDRDTPKDDESVADEPIGEGEKDTGAETENKETGKGDVEIIIDDRPLEEILSELDELVGLREIKNKIDRPKNDKLPAPVFCALPLKN